jgi:hypothetical protein
MKQVQHERTLLLVDLILNEFVLSHFDYFPLFLVSSPLFYAFTQAVGTAYRLKLGKEHCHLLLWKGAHRLQTFTRRSILRRLGISVVFLCRNIGCAISTPVTDQYRGAVSFRGPWFRHGPAYELMAVTSSRSMLLCVTRKNM